MRGADLNLALRPFRNDRPVVRAAVALWILGLALLAVNVWIYRGFVVGTEDLTGRLAELEATLDEQAERRAALVAELESFDLEEQNEEVGFLNRRIESRRFSWNRLLSEIGEILPRDARLLSLAPAEERRRRSGAAARREAAEAESGTVSLQIVGMARQDDAILAFVDALFADPLFFEPILIGEADAEGGEVSFRLAVTYDAASAEAREATEPSEPIESDTDDAVAVPARLDSADAPNAGTGIDPDDIVLTARDASGSPRLR